MKRLNINMSCEDTKPTDKSGKPMLCKCEKPYRKALKKLKLWHNATR